MKPGADDDAAQAAFRAEVRAWIATVAPSLPPRRWHPRDVFTDAGSAEEAAQIDVARHWQRALHDRGWAAVHWPLRFGGCGLGRIEAGIVEQELSRQGIPRSVFGVGIGMVGPTLIASGTAEQQRRHLGPILAGDEIWCQLFSEPDAGSDLAAMSTRARRHGDSFVVDGQKIWSSGAHHSRYGLLLARTNPDTPPHRGITCFLLDMRTPGIDVRPVRQMTGVAHFNAVHLDGVVVPTDAVVGAVDAGWAAALTTLANERNVTGRTTAGETLAELTRAARRHGRAGDRRTRQALARVYTTLFAFDCLLLRARSSVRGQAQPGPESSVLKLALSLDAELLATTALGLQGADGLLAAGANVVGDGDEDGDGDGVWRTYFLAHWGARIGGGTDQIQRNIIGERILGLAREPRPGSSRP